MSALKVVLLDPPTVIYLFNLAVAASLVCGVGLLAARVCRRRSAPVRHGILVGTLALVLLSPGAVRLGQQSGLTWMQVAVPEQPDSASFSQRVSIEPLPGQVSREEEPAVSMDIEQWSATEPPRVPSAASVESSPGKLAPAAEAPPHAVCSWQVLGTVLAFGWMVGILVHVIRLVWGYRVLGSLRRCLEEVAEPRVRALARQAGGAVGRRDAPRIFRSPFAPAPLCLGLVKPVVVVPEEILRELDDGQLQAILIHEAAHLARHDTWVSLAQRIAVVLFWWNVLVYRLRDQIADLREDICDNYVCKAQRETPRFARTLIELAARATTQRFQPEALGILEPAGLMGRVARLLNKERNTATRMSPVSRVLVLTWTVAVLLAIVLVGGLRVAHSGAMAVETATTAGEKPALATDLRAPVGSAAASQSAAAIQGSWQVESLEQAQGRGEAESVPLKLAIDQTTIGMRRGRQFVAETPYSLDAGQTPPAIKFSFNGRPMHGICRPNGNRLTICLTPADQALPKKFELGPEGGQLLLVLLRATDKVKPIWVMDVDGKNLRPVASAPEYTVAGSPRWSPDGKRFAFDACRPDFEEGFSPYSHVFVANADGTGIRDLGDGAMPSWSPEGKRLALSRYGVNRGVWIMNADGSRAELLDENGWAAAWSPTAPRVAYTVYDGFAPNIRVRDLDQPNGRTLLTRRYARIHFNLCWSPDGQWIALQGITPDNQRQLAAVHVEGEARGFKLFWPARLDGQLFSPAPKKGEEFGGNVSWSGDGRRLLVSVFAPDGRSSKLCYLDAARQRPPQFVPGQPPGWRIYGMDLSPDGKKILLNGFVPPPPPAWESAKLIGDEMLSNPSFDTRMTGWLVYSASPASVTGIRDAAVYDTAPAGARVTCTGSGSICLFTANGLSITAGQWYLLSFRAKSTQAFTVPAVTLGKETPPWTSYAVPYSNEPAVTKDWATYKVLFQATTTAADARLTFNLGRALGVGSSFYIDTLSLRPCQFPGGRPWPNVDVSK